MKVVSSPEKALAVSPRGQRGQRRGRHTHHARSDRLKQVRPHAARLASRTLRPISAAAPATKTDAERRKSRGTRALAEGAGGGASLSAPRAHDVLSTVTLMRVSAATGGHAHGHARVMVGPHVEGAVVLGVRVHGVDEMGGVAARAEAAAGAAAAGLAAGVAAAAAVTSVAASGSAGAVVVGRDGRAAAGAAA